MIDMQDALGRGMPVVEDGGAKLDNAGEFALERYGETSGSGWLNIGLYTITAATEEFIAANEAHALSIDPHAVDSMLKKLTEMQDTLDLAAGRSGMIGSSTPLGSGYAEEVGQVNRDIGREALDRIIPKFRQAIEDLKAEIHRSRAAYQTTDATQADEWNNMVRNAQP
ncbi:hypothetical protein ADK67_21285 [Saccharothrix sp. NRRL B-16348]|nr:hypothetical protein ADK67_21285 [Saccharothrix sp. NRRL B-16348]